MGVFYWLRAGAEVAHASTVRLIMSYSRFFSDAPRRSVVSWYTLVDMSKV